MECYIDDRDQDICLFDPVSCIAKMDDRIHQFSKKLFVCNREPYCDCQKEDMCICDDDNYSPVKVDLHIGSGCKWFTSDDNISYNTKSKTVNVQVNYMHFLKHG